jgi:hypothetical protein
VLRVLKIMVNEFTVCGMTWIKEFSLVLYLISTCSGSAMRSFRSSSHLINEEDGNGDRVFSLPSPSDSSVKFSYLVLIPSLAHGWIPSCSERAGRAFETQVTHRAFSVMAVVLGVGNNGNGGTGCHRNLARHRAQTSPAFFTCYQDGRLRPFAPGRYALPDLPPQAHVEPDWDGTSHQYFATADEVRPRIKALETFAVVSIPSSAFFHNVFFSRLHRELLNFHRPRVRWPHRGLDFDQR